MNDLVRYTLDDGVARVVIDDGKVNVMSLAMLRALDTALDRAERDGVIVCLSSARPVFSAGFDLKVFAAGDENGSQKMVQAGAELALRLLGHPHPVLGVCSGHAYPMGAFLLLACDVRIAAEGAWRIGLNEVAIGIPVPSFALELARSRLTPAALARTALTGRMVEPAEGLTAGFFDSVVAPGALAAEVEAALTLLKAAHRPSHATTKRRLRAAAIASVRAAIDAELTPEAYRTRGPTAVRAPGRKPAPVS